MRLYDVVADRPIKETPVTPIVCPWCGDKRVQTAGLVERHEVPERPTRVRQRFRCDVCHKGFVRESLAGNYWYHDGDGLLLRGVPDKPEGYRFTCLHCAARVQPELDEEQNVKIVHTPYGPSKTVYTAVNVTMKCPECGHGGEIDVR